LSSKVCRDTLQEAVREVLHGNQRRRRKFLETLQLQINLENYAPQDKRFSGTVLAPILSLSFYVILESPATSLDFRFCFSHL
uniref:Uncharacterized protein n=1 Tax=Urocitellus parryii TaxID=9999 RepID=A0A8D2IMB6_UROPR